MRGALRNTAVLRAIMLLAAVLPIPLSATIAAASEPADATIGAYLQQSGSRASQLPAAPPRRLAFTHITAQQGLSSDLGQATVQDGAGFVWIGTSNGLNRYSGSEVVIYQHKPDDPTSLSNTFVRSLFADNAGQLWVGTNSGLNLYNRATDSFRAYLPDPGDPTSLSTGAVLAIFQDRSGTFWIGTDGGGLDKFNPSTGTFNTYRHDLSNPRSLSNDSIHAIYQDRDGNLWVGTYGGGLDRFDPATGVFTAYRHDPAHPRSISSDLVTKLVQDQSGTLWVGTFGGGLDRFDPKSGTFTSYLPDPDKPGTLNDDRVMSLCVDRTGALWVGTYAGGVNIFDAQAQRFTAYPVDLSDRDSLTHNRVLDLYEDRSGLMWVTTEGGGINLYNPQQQAFTVYRNNPADPDSLASNALYAVYQDSRGMIWLGTQERGLDRLDPLTGKATHYPPDPSNPQKLGNPTIFGLTGDGGDGVWVTTYGGGLYHLDPATGIFTSYRHDPSNSNSLSDDTLTAIARDNAGRLWLSTTTGLDRFDPKIGIFTSYRSDPSNPRSLTSGLMIAVMVARDGTVWTSGPTGLNHLDPATGEVTRYQHDPKKPDSVSDSFVFKVYQDAAETIWAAGFDGTLNRFNPQSGGFDHFLDNSTGPAENLGSIFDEVIDGKPTGNLWIMRDHSLVKFDTHTHEYRVYTTADGLPDVQATRGGSPGNNGELLIGTTRGLVIADPAKVQTDTEPPQIAFTDFLLENKQVPAGDGTVLKKSIVQTGSVKLSYEDRIVSFGFTALNFRGPQQVRYRYMLDGFDTDWNEVDSSRRVATYTNLPPGNYTFRVTAANADGVWNDTGRAITLVVVPPWWEMPGVRVAAILLALGIVGVLYWLRVRAFGARQQALEMGISERTAALQAEIGVRKETEAALQRSNEELSALNRMAQTLTEWADLSRALEGVGVTLSSLFEGAGVSIWALDDRQRLLTRLLAVSDDRLISENREVSLEGDPVTRDVLDHLQLEVLDAGSPLPLIAGPPNPDGKKPGEVMLVPLQSRGDSVGIMCIRAATPEHRFTNENTVLAQTIGGTVANVLENARLVAAERAAVAEEERANIARELHDSVSQSLYAANLTAEVLPDIWEANPQKGREATFAVRQFTQSAMAQMRSLLVELRPTALINTSLSDLLETLKVAFPLSYTLQVDTVVAPAPLLPPEVQIALYRIAQEALNNIIKHAHASNARINLILTPPYVEQAGSEPWRGTLALRISDDGRGYDIAHRPEGRLGVDSMLERATSIGAVLNITSSPGEGTQVEVRWAGGARKAEKAPQ